MQEELVHWDLPQFEVLRPFDTAVSTEDHYSCMQENIESALSLDLLSTIRNERVDYGYHTTYVESRRVWQNSLINAITSTSINISDHVTSNVKTRWIVFTGGAMGSGKSHMMRWLLTENFLPINGLVAIDPDKIRRALPEWPLYVEAGGNQAGYLTHKESCLIAELSQEVALRNERNIWVDGSLRDTAWYLKTVIDIRKRFPDYRIAVLYVTAPREVILRRVETRGRVTGRFVAVEKVDASIEGSARTVKKLQTLVDVSATIDNQYEHPCLPELVSVETGGVSRNFSTWDRFSEIFVNPDALEPWIALSHFSQVFDKILCFGHHLTKQRILSFFEQRSEIFCSESLFAQQLRNLLQRE